MFISVYILCDHTHSFFVHLMCSHIAEYLKMHIQLKVYFSNHMLSLWVLKKRLNETG